MAASPTKFTTLDLSGQYTHARADAAPWDEATAEAVARLPAGARTFWGVPFAMPGPTGGAPSLVVAGMGGSTDAVSLPAGGAASHVVFLHICDARGRDPGPPPHADYPIHVAKSPGEHLADYVLVYADGAEEAVPVRRQFEINQPLARPQSSYAARHQQELIPLDFRGPCPRDQWGRMQTGVNVGELRPVRGGQEAPTGSWLLYALPNPRPDRAIASIRVEPTGAASIGIGAVTLFHGSEHPLRHRRLETYAVELPGSPAAEDIQAEVDLGIVARKYAVPAFDPFAWLEAPVHGWGEREDGPPAAAPLMLDVTASVDATLTVGGHDFEMSDLETEGATESTDGRARIRLLTPQRQWVHTRIVDAATGRPTPARVHFRAPDGRYIPPYGHRHEVNDNWFEDYGADLKLGSTQYAYVDGTLQGELPVGDVYVEAVKGFEYRPLRQRVRIEPGQRELELRLERIANTRPDGWVTADTHTHFLSPETARLEAEAEGINLINLLAAQWGDLFTSVGDMTGALSGSSKDDVLVWVGSENRQHFMGHINLLAYSGAPIFPMSTSGPSEGYFGDPTQRAMSEWAEECRRKEGVVVVPHFPFPESEVFAEVIRGVVDGLEIRDFWAPGMDTFAVHEWYRLLNAGYRVAAVGGTDKMSAGMPVGGVRTYANIGDEELSFASWGRAVRAGRTVTTAGPLLTFTVDGHPPGDEIRTRDGRATVHVQAEARSTAPLQTLEVVLNGSVVAQERALNGALSLRLAADVRLDGSGWLAARCGSENVAWHVWPVNMNAHTSPVYVIVDGAAVFQRRAGEHLITVMQGGLAWLDTLAIPESPERHEQIRRVFEEAIADVTGKMPLPDGHGHRHG